MVLRIQNRQHQDSLFPVGLERRPVLLGTRETSPLSWPVQSSLDRLDQELLFSEQPIQLVSANPNATGSPAPGSLAYRLANCYRPREVSAEERNLTTAGQRTARNAHERLIARLETRENYVLNAFLRVAREAPKRRIAHQNSVASEHFQNAVTNSNVQHAQELEAIRLRAFNRYSTRSVRMRRIEMGMRRMNQQILTELRGIVADMARHSGTPTITDAMRNGYPIDGTPAAQQAYIEGLLRTHGSPLVDLPDSTRDNVINRLNRVRLLYDRRLQMYERMFRGIQIGYRRIALASGQTTAQADQGVQNLAVSSHLMEVRVMRATLNQVYNVALTQRNGFQFMLHSNRVEGHMSGQLLQRFTEGVNEVHSNCGRLYQGVDWVLDLFGNGRQGQIDSMREQLRGSGAAETFRASRAVLNRVRPQVTGFLGSMGTYWTGVGTHLGTYQTRNNSMISTLTPLLGTNRPIAAPTE